MAAHARLKNEFMEDEKYHNLVSWLILGYGNDPKCSDRQVLAKIIDSEGAVWWGSTLFAIPAVTFGCTTAL